MWFGTRHANKCSDPANCRVLYYILACETILSSAYQKAYASWNLRNRGHFSPETVQKVNLCSLYSRRGMSWSFHWDPQREVTRGHLCCQTVVAGSSLNERRIDFTHSPPLLDLKTNWQWLRTTLGEMTQVSVPLSHLKQPAVPLCICAYVHTSSSTHVWSCEVLTLFISQRRVCQRQEGTEFIVASNQLPRQRYP